MFEYLAELDRVVDGDTIDVTIDLGFKIFKKERVRLARINAPESRTRDLEEKERGLAATAFLKDVLVKDQKMKLRTFKDKGKYGRFVADVLIACHTEVNDNKLGEEVTLKHSMEWINVNDMMVEAGHAVYKDY